MALGSTTAAVAALIASAAAAHGQPYFEFDAQNAVLSLVRIQKVEIPKCSPRSAEPCACKNWSDALIEVPAVELTPYKHSGDFGAWEPWSGDELAKIQDCDHFPCAVKFDARETGKMKDTASKDRLPEFLKLVGERVDRYEKTQARSEYEFPGNPVDPWKLFDDRGYRISVPRPEPRAGALAGPVFLRVLDFAPGKIQKMHQVVDRRVAVSPIGSSGNEAAVWLRDVYTDHYFDSWGEYGEVSCDPEQGLVYVIQSLIGEMDMLKKTGIVAAISRPKLRSAFEVNGKAYLTRLFEDLKKRAEQKPAVSPQPSPLPRAK